MAQAACMRSKRVAADTRALTVVAPAADCFRITAATCSKQPRLQQQQNALPCTALPPPRLSAPLSHTPARRQLFTTTRAAPHHNPSNPLPTPRCCPVPRTCAGVEPDPRASRLTRLVSDSILMLVVSISLSVMDSMMVMYRRIIIWFCLSLPLGISSLLKPGSMDII